MNPRFIPLLRYLLAAVVLCLVSVLLRQYNYLLFHSMVEIFSIIISTSIFILTWNSRKQTQDLNLYFLGIAYLFIGLLDLLHTLAFNGMGIFPAGDYTIQLWVASRYLESISLLLFASLLMRKIRQYQYVSLLMGSYIIITAAVLGSIFYWHTFPLCYNEVTGLTPFKVISEYIICGILLAAVLLLWIRRRQLDKKLLNFFIASIFLTICSEMAFTLYKDLDGPFNMVGHILKLLSFYLIYRSIIISLIQRPVDLLFAQLKNREHKLTRSNEIKTKFFSILAHDVRAPFSGILGFLHLLDTYYERLQDYERQEYIKRCLHGTELAFNLFDNLLVWARSQLENIKYQPENIDLSSLVDLNIELLRTNAVQKEINVQKNCTPGVYAFADRNMVNLILRNLLSNAIKFTGTGGHITVDVKNNRELLKIAVKDNGIGMEEQEVRKLFQMDNHFSRQGTDEEQGTGLGLILVKEFVEKNRGEVSVESRAGLGSTFSFTLPAAQQL